MATGYYILSGVTVAPGETVLTATHYAAPDAGADPAILTNLVALEGAEGAPAGFEIVGPAGQIAIVKHAIDATHLQLAGPWVGAAIAGGTCLLVMGVNGLPIGRLAMLMTQIIVQRPFLVGSNLSELSGNPTAQAAARTALAITAPNIPFTPESGLSANTVAGALSELNSEVIRKDGSTAITQNIPFNSKLITGLGSATAPDHAMNRLASDARYGQFGGSNVWTNSQTFTAGITLKGFLSGGRMPVSYTNSLGQIRWWFAIQDDGSGSNLTLSRFTGVSVYANDPISVSSSSGTTTFATGVLANATFQSTSQFAILGTTGAGSVFIRPNGPASTAGELAVDSAGGVSMSGAPRPTTDNAVPLGLSFARWSVVYAGTGAINTSDQREKTDLQQIDGETALALLDAISPYWFRFLEGQVETIESESQTETEEVQATEEIETVVESIVVENGSAVRRRVARTEERPLYDELPLFDDDGNRAVRVHTETHFETRIVTRTETGPDGNPVDVEVEEQVPVEVAIETPLFYAVPRMITRPKRIRERVVVTEGARTHAGFIAQHVHDALISVGRDPTGHAMWTLADPADPESRQGLRETHLLAILWAATKALRGKIAALEAA